MKKEHNYVAHLYNKYRGRIPIGVGYDQKLSEIRKLIDLDFIVICCGAGGIPVIRKGRAFSGVDAVIDKDLASSCLAKEVGVDIFLIATDVPSVSLNYGQPSQEDLRTLSVMDAAELLSLCHFESGSMGPKVEAAVRFIQNGGRLAVITSLDKIEKAVDGNAGTEIGNDFMAP
jgi:carbamate kinase